MASSFSSSSQQGYSRMTSAQICRYLCDPDTSRISAESLQAQLDTPDMIRRLQLNVRYYKKIEDKEAKVEPKDQTLVIKNIRSILDLSLKQTSDLCSLYLKSEVRDQHDSTGVNAEDVLEFYLHERVQVIYALSLLIKTAGGATNSPYIGVARKILPKIENLFDNVLQSYTELSEADVPVQLSYEKGAIWADSFVKEQAMLLQVIVGIFGVFVDSPSEEQARSVLRVCQSTQFGGRPVIYTMLSANGREYVKCIGALWNQILADVMQIPYVSKLLQQDTLATYPKLAIGDPKIQLELDERWFSGLGDMEEHGPALLSWSVFLCLSYQVLEKSRDGASTNLNARIADMQQRLLDRLRPALRINALGTITSSIEGLDRHPLLEYAALLARDTYKELLFGMSISNVYNVVTNVPRVHVSHLFPLYALLLQHSPELCNEMWEMIQTCIQKGSDLRAFPTFVFAYQQFVSALPISFHKLGELVILIELLTAMSSSRSCAEYAKDTLRMAAPEDVEQAHDGLDRLKKTYLQLIQCIAISQAIPSEDQWRFIAAMTKFLHRCAVMCPDTVLPDDICEAVLRLLAFLAETSSSSTPASSLKQMSQVTDACLGILSRGSFSPQFASMIVKYSVPSIAPRILHNIDAPSGRYAGVCGFIRLTRTILEKSEHQPAFNESSMESTMYRMTEFVERDVLALIDTWKFSEGLGRWRVSEEMFRLFDKLLSCTSLGTGGNLLASVGRRFACSILTQAALQKAILHPIVCDRPYLSFVQPKVVYDTVARLTDSAFRVLDRLLELRFDWASADPPVVALDDSLFNTFFSSGVEASLMLRVILSYMDVQESRFHNRVIDTLTRLCNLSALLPDCYGTSYSLAGYLGSANVDTLRRKCARMLERRPASSQFAVINLLCAALRYQAGLAERLFGFAPKKEDLLENSVWYQLKDILIKSKEPAIIEHLLKVLVTLWEAAGGYRNIAAIIDIIVKWEEFWSAMSACLSWERFEDGNELTSIKAQAWALRVITCELRYTDGKSSSLQQSQILSKVLTANVASAWLMSMLPPSNSTWAEMSRDAALARAHFVSQLKLFIEAVLLLSPETIARAGDLLRLLLQRLSDLIQCDDLPIAIVAEFVAVLLPLVRFCIVHKIEFDAQPLLEAVTTAMTSSDVWYSRQLKTAQDENSEVLQLRIKVLEKLLTASVLLLSELSCSSPVIASCVSRLFRVSCRFVASESLACLPPLLLEHVRCARDYIEPLCDPQLVALSATGSRTSLQKTPLSLMLQTLATDDDRARTRSVLRFVLRICDHPHGAAVLVREGLIGAINNCFLRTADLSVFDVSGKRSERHLLWCLTLDVIVALLRSFGEQSTDLFDAEDEINMAVDESNSSADLNQFLREIGEFLVVFRRQICVGLRTTSASGSLQISEGALEEMDRLCNLLYEVSRVPSRWKIVPNVLLNEHRQLVRFLAVIYSKLLADTPRLEVCARERVFEEAVATAPSSLSSSITGSKPSEISLAVVSTRPSRLLKPLEDRTHAPSAIHLKKLELRLCHLLCSAFSFLRVFTPDFDSSIALSELMFSCDVTYRTCAEDTFRLEPPPLTFLIELIDYALMKLSRDVRKSAGMDNESRAFVESNLDEFERVHRFLFEHSMYMLLAYARIYFADLSKVPSNVIQDFVDVFERLRRSSESLTSSLSADGVADFLVDSLLEPMRELEQRLVYTLRSSANTLARS